MKKVIFYSIIFCQISLQWCQGQSYTLKECIRIALQNKETVKVAALDVKSARIGKRGSLSNILPSLRVAGGLDESSFPGREFTIDPVTGEPVAVAGTAISSLTTWSSGLSVSQTLYDGGNWWNQITRANNNYLINQQLERQVWINVIREVHRTFFQLLKAERLLEVAHKSLELAEQQVELVKRQFELGAVKKTDLLKSEVQKGQAQVDVLNRKSALENAHRELRNAMGLMGTDVRFTIIDRAEPLKPIPMSKEAFITLEEQNPSLLAKRGQIKNSEIQYKLIRGLRLPSITASVNYSASADKLNQIPNAYDENWSLNSRISLSLPIFSGFDLSTRSQQAHITWSKGQNEYVTQKNDLAVQLESLLEILQNYREVIPINEEVLMSAEEDLKLVQERYALGSATILEILDAQVSVTQARSDLITIKYDARIQEANLKAILGTLDQEFEY